jgi:uncharacterized protein (DUF427 family)
MKAVWNNQVIAESNETINLENNEYFPVEAVNQDFLVPSETHTTCPWKGEASYYTLEVAGKRNPDAAWFYPNPKSAASQIKNYVAFWKGVQVSK